MHWGELMSLSINFICTSRPRVTRPGSTSGCTAEPRGVFSARQHAQTRRWHRTPALRPASTSSTDRVPLPRPLLKAYRRSLWVQRGLHRGIAEGLGALVLAALPETKTVYKESHMA